jgi:hypothetical protein
MRIAIDESCGRTPGYTSIIEKPHRSLNRLPNRANRQMFLSGSDIVEVVEEEAGLPLTLSEPVEMLSLRGRAGQFLTALFPHFVFGTGLGADRLVIVLLHAALFGDVIHRLAGTHLWRLIAWLQVLGIHAAGWIGRYHRHLLHLIKPLRHGRTLPAGNPAP